MTSTQPWDVRHIYTTADPKYDNVASWSYLTKLKEKLQEQKDASRIRGNWQDCPVGVSRDIGTELQKSKRGELVIVREDVDKRFRPGFPGFEVVRA